MSRPNKVDFVTRRVIEKKLLDSLEKGGQVAILCTEADLKLLENALNELLELSGRYSEDTFARAEELSKGLMQMRKGAFPK